MALPTFLGIGVPRGGTTWLHTLLETHPNVCVPTQRKEIRFFDRHYERGTEWYEAFFAAANGRSTYRAVGEISPQYLYCDECPERIGRLLPEIKMIIMLRHPVDRAYSHYGFCVQRRNYRGSFREFLSSRSRALEMGYYSRYLHRYLDCFPQSRFLALVADKAFSDVTETRRKLATFLEIPVEHFPDAAPSGKVNASTVPRAGSVSRLAVTSGRKLRRMGLEPVVDLARRVGAQRVIGKGRPLPKIDPETRAELCALYDAEFTELERCLELDLSHWRN